MRRAAVAAVAALAAGGCGEDRSALTATDTTTAPRPPAAPPQPPAPPRAEVGLVETEYRLDPARIRVDRPATLAITVRNRGRERHALAVEEPAGDERTAPLAPRERATLTVRLDRPGRYRWYCPVDGHVRRGMAGSIAVARAR